MDILYYKPTNIDYYHYPLSIIHKKKITSKTLPKNWKVTHIIKRHFLLKTHFGSLREHWS